MSILKIRESFVPTSWISLTIFPSSYSKFHFKYKRVGILCDFRYFFYFYYHFLPIASFILTYLYILELLFLLYNKFHICSTWKNMVLEKNVKNKMDRYNNELWSFSKGERRKINFKNKKNGRHSWIGHTIRHNKFAVNILEWAIFGKKMPWEELYCST